jgi:hypothetical protein
VWQPRAVLLLMLYQALQSGLKAIQGLQMSLVRRRCNGPVDDVSGCSHICSIPQDMQSVTAQHNKMLRGAACVRLSRY